MTAQECIKQLESLRAHCDVMCSDKFVDADPWDADCMALDMAIAAMENGDKALKAADVAPVVHGRWADVGGGEWCCTTCGYVISTEGSWEHPYQKYCDECGAKMDKED